MNKDEQPEELLHAINEAEKVVEGILEKTPEEIIKIRDACLGDLFFVLASNELINESLLVALQLFSNMSNTYLDARLASVPEKKDEVEE